MYMCDPRSGWTANNAVGTRYKPGGEPRNPARSPCTRCVSGEAHQVGKAGAHAGGEAAVDHQGVAGDERGVVGRQEQHRGGELLRASEPAELVRPAVVVEVG